MELQELKDRLPHLRNLPNKTYNLNEVNKTATTSITLSNSRNQVKAATWAVKSKIVWALSGSLPANQAATLATTATSTADNKLA